MCACVSVSMSLCMGFGVSPAGMLRWEFVAMGSIVGESWECESISSHTLNTLIAFSRYVCACVYFCMGGLCRCEVEQRVWVRFLMSVGAMKLCLGSRLLSPPFFHVHMLMLFPSVRTRLWRSSGSDGVNWRPPTSFRLLHSWLWRFSSLHIWAWSQHRPAHQDLCAGGILQGLCHHRHGNVHPSAFFMPFCV